jgi:phosphatidylserine/phosphatidylglycerophosphate/cardiolipin synthase-like enzyme
MPSGRLASTEGGGDGSFDALLHLIRRSRESEILWDRLRSALRAGDGEAALSVDSSRSALWEAAVRHSGMVLSSGEVAADALAKLAQAELLFYGGDEALDRWAPVITLPPFLSGMELPQGVLNTSEELERITASATHELILAAPFLDSGIAPLLKRAEALLNGGGRLLLVTRDVLDRSSRNAKVLARLRDLAPPAGRLQLAAWEENGLGIHMKVAVADSRLAYLGSANFTWGGLSDHAEMGVVIEGDGARVIRDLLVEIAHRVAARGTLQAR